MHYSISKIIYSDETGIIPARQDKWGDDTGQDEQQTERHPVKEVQHERWCQQEHHGQAVD